MDLLKSFGFIPEPTLWDKINRTCELTFTFILPYAATLYWYIFFTLLVVATVGRKLKLRRFYIQVLDRLFYIAALKMEEKLYKEKMKRRMSFMEEEEDDTDAEHELDQEVCDTREVRVHSEPKNEEVQRHNSELRNKTTFRGRKYSALDGAHTESIESRSDDLKLQIMSNMNNFKDVKRRTGLSSSEEDTSTMNKIDDKISKQIYDATKEDSRSTDTTSLKCPPGSVEGGIQSIESSSESGIQSTENNPDSGIQPLENSPDSGIQSAANNPDTAIQSAENSPDSSIQSPEDRLDSGTSNIKFPLEAPMLYIAAGVRAILDDCVSSSFSPEQVKTWNLLSRTILKMERIRQSRSLMVFFVTGFIFRYLFLMPMRVLVLILSLANLTLCTFLVGCLPSGRFKRVVNSYVVSWGFDFVAGSLSVVARFHNKENRPSHGIAVANHTSPIDGMVLATDNCYDMVGQRSRGLLGMFMNALAKSSGHIWFERSDARDRQATTRLLYEHTQDPDLPPILLFPEGVCVNNTAVLEFRKGAFEVDCDIFPIAVRFDPVYGDAFWFEGGFTSYCFSMMTSWAIVCDVFYLPPMRKNPGESASLFASRVRSCIAKQAGLVELEWNSMVKSSVFSQERWNKLKLDRQREKQKLFARTLSQEDHQLAAAS